MKLIGRVVFWCAWPLFWFVVPLTRRVRVIVLKDDKVLGVKNLIGPNRWDLPGGGIKRGETAEMAAKRELMEELNLIVTKTIQLNTEEVIRRFSGLSMRVTFVQAEVEKLESLQKNWEIADVQWLKKPDLGSLLPKI